MDAKLKADWVKALRSGEYRQGAGYLFHKGAFCCLGVLLTIQGCDIETSIPEVGDRMTSTLPSAWKGGLRDFEATDLANRNDGSCGCRRHGFPEIADYIEVNL